jgi:ribose transport system permease protein
VLLSRTNSGQPSSGTGYEMDAITAVVLGGVSLNGGEGKLSLVLVGVLIMGILTTGMLMDNINDYVQQVVKGLVLIFAVAFSMISKKIKFSTN